MIPNHLTKFQTPIPVLDHGYIMLVDVMGDDDAIVQAARVSYAQGTRKSSNDRNLLRYLLRSRHTSPFEQARIKLEIKLPIFVERQWVRHRMASLNEMSARYSILPDEFYFPDEEDVRVQSTSNKQGRGELLDREATSAYLNSLRKTCANAYTAYQQALTSGVTRELARCLLPVNVYTSKVWTMDLHNLFHFLALRMDSHAQKEIRDYANAIASIVKEWVPWAWEAFEDYRLGGMHLTRFEVKALKALLKNPCPPPPMFSCKGVTEDQMKDLREKVAEALRDPTVQVVTNDPPLPVPDIDLAIEASGLPPKSREAAELKAKLDRLME